MKSSPAIVNGKVFIGSLDQKVYALNLLTGASQEKSCLGSDARDKIYSDAHKGVVVTDPGQQVPPAEF